MCHCTYCKDIYVGNLRLRFLSLFNSRIIALLWNFRWTIVEICSILFVTLVVIEAVDQHRKLFFFFCSYQCNIVVPVTARTQSTTVQATGGLKAYTFICHLQLSFTPRENYLYLSCCWPLLSLYNSQVCFLGLLYLFFKQEYFTKPLKYNSTVFSVSSGCMEK